MESIQHEHFLKLRYICKLATGRQQHTTNLLTFL